MKEMENNNGCVNQKEAGEKNTDIYKHLPKDEKLIKVTCCEKKL